MLTCSVFALVVLIVPAEVPEEVLPPASRPDGFSGAVGVYEITATAQPLRVRVEEPFILTVRITGDAQAARLPSELQPTRRLPALTGLKVSFEIDELPERDARPDPNTWVFSYRLRPRSTRVKAIPRLEYIFWNPSAGQFGSTFSRSSISLTVLPRSVVPESQQRGNSEANLGERYPFQTGAALLERWEPEALPSVWLLGLALLAPPFVCLGWWILWRRWFPDAARQAGRRRSRAARLALKALRPIRSLPADEAGARLAAIVTQYLRQRLDFSAEEPTPFEATAHLQQEGIDAELAEQVSELIRACDAARFTASFLVPREDLVGCAADLIRKLEEQPCLSQPA
jgi:hypothetical protein